MTFHEYENTVEKFDVSPGELWYYGLGLAGEVGEAVDKLKKFYRDGVDNRVAIGAELGDALWYLTRLGTKIGFALEDIAKDNVTKLTARLKTGTLHGNGDYRERRA